MYISKDNMNDICLNKKSNVYEDNTYKGIYNKVMKKDDSGNNLYCDNINDDDDYILNINMNDDIINYSIHKSKEDNEVLNSLYIFLNDMIVDKNNIFIFHFKVLTNFINLFKEYKYYVTVENYNFFDNLFYLFIYYKRNIIIYNEINDKEKCMKKILENEKYYKNIELLIYRFLSKTDFFDSSSLDELILFFYLLRNINNFRHFVFVLSLFCRFFYLYKTKLKYVDMFNNISWGKKIKHNKKKSIRRSQMLYNQDGSIFFKMIICFFCAYNYDGFLSGVPILKIMKDEKEDPSLKKKKKSTNMKNYENVQNFQNGENIQNKKHINLPHDLHSSSHLWSYQINDVIYVYSYYLNYIKYVLLYNPYIYMNIKNKLKKKKSLEELFYMFTKKKDISFFQQSKEHIYLCSGNNNIKDNNLNHDENEQNKDNTNNNIYITTYEEGNKIIDVCFNNFKLFQERNKKEEEEEDNIDIDFNIFIYLIRKINDVLKFYMYSKYISKKYYNIKKGRSVSK
ncbi:conserved Plasmodium membrane protein, unknown function [Plasmodium sp. DRC-Itaito]|nr:conserved Plasmodium membrane protein, unknown function [Plasmodium sp. DRC-Itaito]